MPTSATRHLSVVADRQTAGRVALSTALVMGATLASLVLGFLREIIIARNFGAQWELDAFLAAAVMPTILFGIFGGALVTALVPIFSSYVADDHADEASALASTLVIVVLAVLVPAAALFAWLAPWYVPLIARFPPEHQRLAIDATRALMPTIVFISIGGIFTALLNAHHRFGGAALQGAVANIVVVAALLVAAPQFGIQALIWGSVLGTAAQLVIQAPSLGKLAIVSRIDLRHPGLRRLAIAIGPIAIGSAAGQIALFFDRYFASGLAVGTIAGMNYAVKLAGFPQQIFVTAIATVVFPLLAAQHASANRVALRHSLETALRMTLFLALPSSVGLCMLAGPLVAALFERGAFTPEDTVLCASLVPYAAAGLVALAANVILTRYLFAAEHARAAIAISVGTVLVNVLLSVVLLPWLGARGLLLANAVSQTGQAVSLGFVAWTSLGGFDVRAVARSFFKIGLCSMVMGISLAVVQIFRQPPDPTLLSRASSLLEHLLFAIAVFAGLARLIDSDELHQAIDILLRRRPRDLISLS